jgi:hypothetical protein
MRRCDKGGHGVEARATRGEEEELSSREGLHDPLLHSGSCNRGI